MSDPAVTPEPPVTEMELVGTEDQCSYLPDQTSRMIWRLARRLTEDRYEQLLERGWRRFGRVLFRPSCPSCTACQGLRVSVNDFQPSGAASVAAAMNLISTRSRSLFSNPHSLPNTSSSTTVITTTCTIVAAGRFVRSLATITSNRSSMGTFHSPAKSSIALTAA